MHRDIYLTREARILKDKLIGFSFSLASSYLYGIWNSADHPDFISYEMSRQAAMASAVSEPRLALRQFTHFNGTSSYR